MGRKRELSKNQVDRVRRHICHHINYYNTASGDRIDNVFCEKNASRMNLPMNPIAKEREQVKYLIKRCKQKGYYKNFDIPEGPIQDPLDDSDEDESFGIPEDFAAPPSRIYRQEAMPNAITEIALDLDRAIHRYIMRNRKLFINRTNDQVNRICQKYNLHPKTCGDRILHISNNIQRNGRRLNPILWQKQIGDGNFDSSEDEADDDDSFYQNLLQSYQNDSPDNERSCNCDKIYRCDLGTCRKSFENPISLKFHKLRLRHEFPSKISKRNSMEHGEPSNSKPGPSNSRSPNVFEMDENESSYDLDHSFENELDQGLDADEVYDNIPPLATNEVQGVRNLQKKWNFVPANIPSIPANIINMQQSNESQRLGTEELCNDTPLVATISYSSLNQDGQDVHQALLTPGDKIEGKEPDITHSTVRNSSEKRSGQHSNETRLGTEELCNDNQPAAIFSDKLHELSLQIKHLEQDRLRNNVRITGLPQSAYNDPGDSASIIESDAQLQNVIATTVLMEAETQNNEQSHRSHVPSSSPQLNKSPLSIDRYSAPSIGAKPLRQHKQSEHPRVSGHRSHLSAQSQPNDQSYNNTQHQPIANTHRSFPKRNNRHVSSLENCSLQPLIKKSRNTTNQNSIESTSYNTSSHLDPMANIPAISVQTNKIVRVLSNHVIKPTLIQKRTETSKVSENAESDIYIEDESVGAIRKKTVEGIQQETAPSDRNRLNEALELQMETNSLLKQIISQNAVQIELLNKLVNKP